MAFPTPWPPRPPSGVRSIRFFVSGTSTANFADNAFLFIDGAAGSANPFTPGPPTSTSSGVTNNPLTPTGTGSQGVVSQLTSPERPLIWSGNIRICNDSTGDLQVSFDGVNVHGVIKAAEVFMYRNRYEAGISVRGVGGTPTFRIEAW